MTQRHSDLCYMIRQHMFAGRVSADEMGASMGLGRTTFYARLRNPDDMSVRELRKLCKTLHVADDPNKIDIVNRLLYGK